MHNIIVIGEGGHSKVIQDIIHAIGKYKIVGILDDKYNNRFEKNGKIYGPVSIVEQLIKTYSKIKLILAIGNNEVRKKIVSELNIKPDFFITLVHPSAIISPSVRIGYGVVVMANSVINVDTVVGNHVIINTGAIIEHDNIISDFSHISPNATLTGNVCVGEGTHIGASATVIPGVTIGNWCTVGAGSVIIRDVEDFNKVVGVPGRTTGQVPCPSFKQ